MMRLSEAGISAFCFWHVFYVQHLALFVMLLKEYAVNSKLLLTINGVSLDHWHIYLTACALWDNINFLAFSQVFFNLGSDLFVKLVVYPAEYWLLCALW